MTPEWYGRINHVVLLRRNYSNAVAACVDANAARHDANVKRTGLLLARAQRTLTKSIMARRLLAARSGVPLDPRTNNPRTESDFLGLILAEQRGIRAALETVCSHIPRT